LDLEKLPRSKTRIDTGKNSIPSVLVHHYLVSVLKTSSKNDTFSVGLFSQEYLSLLEVETSLYDWRRAAKDLVRRQGELGEDGEQLHHDRSRRHFRRYLRLETKIIWATFPGSIIMSTFPKNLMLNAPKTGLFWILVSE
jgi:hypothetical protein